MTLIQLYSFSVGPPSALQDSRFLFPFFLGASFLPGGRWGHFLSSGSCSSTTGCGSLSIFWFSQFRWLMVPMLQLSCEFVVSEGREGWQIQGRLEEAFRKRRRPSFFAKIGLEPREGQRLPREGKRYQREGTAFEPGARTPRDLPCGTR